VIKRDCNRSANKPVVFVTRAALHVAIREQLMAFQGVGSMEALISGHSPGGTEQNNEQLQDVSKNIGIRVICLRFHDFSGVE
jgi:hypothetical protein